MLFEGLSEGLLWLSAEGHVKFANAQATLLSGLKKGQALADGRLRKVVQGVASGRLEPRVELEFEPPPGARPLLHARVTPALTAGDAFVFLSPPQAYGEALALANLMTVIRTDLSEQLKRLGRGLYAARDSGDVARVAAAIDLNNEVIDTLARLVDLSTLWDSASLLADDRIELWTLLQDVWAEARPFAEVRQVTVRLLSDPAASTSPVIYGSAFWVRRVISESLQAALRAADTGATLDIELRQMGPRVLVVFRNSGMWAALARHAVILNDGHTEPRAGQTARARPTFPEAKDLIGLHLCERIIRLHGGQLREEQDDGLRHFLIDLPTGAPHRDTGEAAVDSAQAQAQRYAADLSVLMARGRRAKAWAGRPTGAPLSAASPCAGSR